LFLQGANKPERYKRHPPRKLNVMHELAKGRVYNLTDLCSNPDLAPKDRNVAKMQAVYHLPTEYRERTLTMLENRMWREYNPNGFH